MRSCAGVRGSLALVDVWVRQEYYYGCALIYVPAMLAAGVLAARMPARISARAELGIFLGAAVAAISVGWNSDLAWYLSGPYARGYCWPDLDIGL